MQLVQEEMEPDAVISYPAQLVTSCKLLESDDSEPLGAGSPQANLQPKGFTYDAVDAAPVDVDVDVLDDPDVVSPDVELRDAELPLGPAAVEPEVAEPEREAELVPEVLALPFVEPATVLAAPGEVLEALVTGDDEPSADVAPVPAPPQAARPHVTVTRPTEKRISMPGPPFFAAVAAGPDIGSENPEARGG